MQTLDGMSSLRTLNAQLIVEKNANLTSIDALTALTSPIDSALIAVRFLFVGGWFVSAFVLFLLCI